VCREDWVIQILHGIQPLCFIPRFGEGIVYVHLFQLSQGGGTLSLPELSSFVSPPAEPGVYCD
jgi:hypothetical protein